MKRLHILYLGVFVFLSCEKKDDTLIDSSGISPFIVSASITPDTIDTDTVNPGTERKPDDVLELNVKTYATVTHPDGLGNISVNARIFGAGSGSLLFSTILLDDGNDVDSTMGDGIFSGWNTFQVTRSEIGTFQVEIDAEDKNGYLSSIHILPLEIVRNNEPPVLSNLQAPDTIRVSQQIPNFLITVNAMDPDGLGDIRQVIFNSFLPGGQPSSQNPFRMYDDGSNGDVTANNGIYSLRIGSPTNPGTYRFEFQAFDFSNAVSNVIIHNIIVIP